MNISDNGNNTTLENYTAMENNAAALRSEISVVYGLFYMNSFVRTRG